jgi:hypothetical protein
MMDECRLEIRQQCGVFLDSHLELRGLGITREECFHDHSARKFGEVKH